MPPAKDVKCKSRSYASINLGYSNPQSSKTCTIYTQILHVPAPHIIGSIQNNNIYAGIWDKTEGN